MGSSYYIYTCAGQLTRVGGARNRRDSEMKVSVACTASDCVYV